MSKKNITLVKDFMSLIKIVISSAVTFTAFTGFVFQNKSLDIILIPTLIGIFLLSSGASAFNQIIEVKTDALMPRTKNRPLPSSRISKPLAMILAYILSFAGLVILYRYTNIICTLLGFFNLIWYNLIYTPLKKKTVWAVFFGTITGVIPFLMGITANSYQELKPAALFVALYMMMWQIPHFLILVSMYGKEYESAGLTSATSRFDEKKLLRISSLWIISSTIITISLPIFGLVQSKITSYLLITTSAIVIGITFWNSFINPSSKNYKPMFILTNLMQAIFMVIISVDSLL